MLLEIGTLSHICKGLEHFNQRRRLLVSLNQTMLIEFFPSLISLSKSTFFNTEINLTAVPLHSAGYQPSIHLHFSQKCIWDANRAPDHALYHSSVLPSHLERFPRIFKIYADIYFRLDNHNTEGTKANLPLGVQNHLFFIFFHAIVPLLPPSHIWMPWTAR